MKIRVRSKKTITEDGQPKIVAELVIELSPVDVQDSAVAGGLDVFYRNFGEDIIDEIHKWKAVKRL